MPYEPLHAVWIGEDLPPWALAGIQELGRSFPLHEKHVFWTSVPQGQIDSREGSSANRTPVSSVATDSVWDVKHLDEAVTAAAEVLARAGSPYGEKFLNRLADVQRVHGNSIAVKDQAFLMILAGMGGYCVDLTISRRNPGPTAGNFAMDLASLPAPPLPPSDLGVRIPFHANDPLFHLYGSESHNPSSVKGLAGALEAPRFDNFALYGSTDVDEGARVGRRFWSDALDRYCRYFEKAVQEGIDRGQVQLEPGTDLHDMKFLRIAKDSSLGQWLDPASSMRAAHIGAASIRAMTEAWIKHFGRTTTTADQQLALHPDSRQALTRTSVRCVRDHDSIHFGASSKVLMNSWRHESLNTGGIVDQAITAATSDAPQQPSHQPEWWNPEIAASASVSTTRAGERHHKHRATPYPTSRRTPGIESSSQPSRRLK